MSQATSLFNQFLDPLAESLTEDAARQILAVRVDPSLLDRVNTLAVKANSGTLTSEERAEYECVIDAADMLSILKAKARAALAQRAS